MGNAYLLDTHTLLWFLNGDNQLSGVARNIISEPGNSCFLSMASVWEIAIKLKLGKLSLDFDLPQLSTNLEKNNIGILSISFEHILETLSLEDLHRDPFDRLIIAQARVEELRLISRDSNFQKYQGISLLW